jgi:hypothetical protein
VYQMAALTLFPILSMNHTGRTRFGVKDPIASEFGEKAHREL